MVRLATSLEPGQVISKDYSEESGGRLFFYENGVDALLAFTNSLLEKVQPYAVLDFPLTRFMSGRTPLWE